FSLQEIGEKGLDVTVTYSKELYAKETIEQMLVHYENLLRSALESPETSIVKLEMLNEEEQDKLLNEFNATSVKYQEQTTVINLFEDQVSKTPDKIALVDGEEVLSYKEVNDQSN